MKLPDAAKEDIEDDYSRHSVMEANPYQAALDAANKNVDLLSSQIGTLEEELARVL